MTRARIPFRPDVRARDAALAQAIVDAFEARRGTKGLVRQQRQEALFEAQRAALRGGMAQSEVIALVYDLQMHERDPRRCRCGSCSDHTREELRLVAAARAALANGRRTP